jgi:aspartate/methionine/tyrosine aminotransferase
MQIFGAAERRRAAGLPVFQLAAGQPSTGAPQPVLRAAADALRVDKIGYTAALGIEPLREAIARHCRNWYGIDVRAEQVVVTTGSSGAFLLAFLAAFSVGDVVAMPRPGYPAYRNILASLGCQVREFDCRAEQGFSPDVGMLDTLLAAEPRLAGLVIASPNNPTGSMVPAAELIRIVAWCEQHGVRLISDEIYHGVTYSGPAASAWQFGQDSVVVNSFSKYFSMTGWRLGWLLVPDTLHDAVDRLAGNYAICPPALSQLAGLAAFDAYPELDANVARYRENRSLLLAALPTIGLDRLAPADGAFYVYAEVSRWTDDSLSWCRRLLDETGVALAPGIDFDTADGGEFVRFSFAGHAEEICGAVERLGEWLALQPARMQPLGS